MDARPPALIRCPGCGGVLGELVAGDLALVRHRKRDMVAVAVGCDRPGCGGEWISARHRGLVDRARGLRRVSPRSGRGPSGGTASGARTPGTAA